MHVLGEYLAVGLGGLSVCSVSFGGLAVIPVPEFTGEIEALLTPPFQFLKFA